MTDRTYQQQTEAITADKTGRVIPRSALRRQQIDLTAALVERPFRLQGDFLYADSNSTGVATVKLNNTSEDPIPMLSQASVEGLPFRDVFVSCAAQPGLVLNLWYGYQVKMRPPQQSVVISGGVSVLQTSFVQAQGPDQASSLQNAWVVAVNAGPVGGNLSFAGIENANGSGKRIYVDVINIRSSLADQVVVAQRPNLTGAGAAGMALQKKLTGGAASANTSRQGTQAAPLGGAVQTDEFQLAAQGRERRIYPNPWIVDPNSGIFLQAQVVNSLLALIMEGREY